MYATWSCPFQEHMAQHTKTALYNCKYCDKGFYNNSNMFKHIRVKHFDKYVEEKEATTQKS